ncbi:MAG: restriction endonuclease [Flavobacteriaceae bacterium]|nr:restriction endonuclease [Flavobacteriaceae bacterium]
MNLDDLTVKKHAGDYELFSFLKLENSLQKSGVSKKESERIIAAIKPHLYNGISTKEIYKKAYQLLKKKDKICASKYSLKRAIFELGPTGYPFEKLIGALLKEKGFQTQVGVILPGACVTHEIDVLATKGTFSYAIECKFHSNSKTVSNVKVPLYINSRFLDIQQQWNTNSNKKTTLRQGWLITNTRFSEDAIKYGKCIGLTLLSWDYPKNKGIKDNVTNFGLYPITALTSLNKREKKLLIENDLILTKDIINNKSLLKRIGIKNEKLDTIINEATKLCNV